MNDYATAAAERAKEAARALAHAVNEMNFDDEAFAEELCHQHRTLQQNAFRTIGAVLIRMAQLRTDDQYDLRNDQATDVARAIVNTFHDQLKYVRHV